MKKLFNVKTGQFLELRKDWLDGCKYIVLIDKLIDKINGADIIANEVKNIMHPLNTMWSGIYNGCVYGDGDYVVVEIGENKTIDTIIQLENGVDQFTAINMDIDYRKIILIIEYSKYLRGEENKLSELENFIKKL